MQHKRLVFGRGWKMRSLSRSGAFVGIAMALLITPPVLLMQVYADVPPLNCNDQYAADQQICHDDEQDALDDCYDDLVTKYNIAFAKKTADYQIALNKYNTNFDICVNDATACTVGVTSFVSGHSMSQKLVLRPRG